MEASVAVSQDHRQRTKLPYQVQHDIGYLAWQSKNRTRTRRHLVMERVCEQKARMVCGVEKRGKKERWSKIEVESRDVQGEVADTVNAAPYSGCSRVSLSVNDVKHT